MHLPNSVMRPFNPRTNSPVFIFSPPSTPLALQVRMQALKCFSVLAYENTQVSMTLVNGEDSSPSLSPSPLISFTFKPIHLLFLLPVLVDGELLSQVFVRMMQRDQPIEMQLTAAKW